MFFDTPNIPFSINLQSNGKDSSYDGTQNLTIYYLQ